MKNRFKSVALAFILGMFGVFAGLGLSGCGGSLSTLKSEYAALEKKIDSYSDVAFIKNGQIDGISTNLEVNYGEFAKSKIEAGDAGFVELKKKYNSILVVSNDYVVQNMQLLLTDINKKQKSLSKAAKKAVKQLCKDVKEFNSYIKTFAVERKKFESYFEQFSDAKEQDVVAQLVTFKKIYGKLVQKNINMSLSVANCMDKMMIYDKLKDVETTEVTLSAIRGYARAKMLPIFGKFMLTETANQFIWDNYKDKSEQTAKIDQLLKKVESVYANEFKYNLLSQKVLTNTSVKAQELFDMVNDFLKEADCYLDALNELDIKEFAVTFDGDMTKYLKQNKLAEIDIHKIDQFLNITLTNFITNFSAKLG